jgi:hypothetical protein
MDHDAGSLHPWDEEDQYRPPSYVTYGDGKGSPQGPPRPEKDNLYNMKDYANSYSGHYAGDTSERPGAGPNVGYLLADDESSASRPGSFPVSPSSSSNKPSLSTNARPQSNKNKGETGPLMGNSIEYSPGNSIKGAARPPVRPGTGTGLQSTENPEDAYLFWSSSKGLNRPPSPLPYDEAAGSGPDLNDYEIDFYGEKNYEYIDTEESEDLEKILEMNGKLGEMYAADIDKIELEFDPVDYQNYDFVEVGVLDFR